MKIAVFYNLAFGGAKRSVFEHVKGLTRLGHTVDVYTTDKEHDMFDPGAVAAKEYYYEFTPKKSALPIIGRLQHDLNTFSSLRKLHKHIAEDIDRGTYDLAFIHSDIFTQAPFILRFLKTTSVYYCLEPLRMVYEYSLGIPENWSFLNKMYETGNRYIRKKIDRINARSADFTLTLSYFGREYMIHAFNLYPKISYLGVDTKLFKPEKIKRKNQVLFVAEKEYIYGYDLAEAAMQYIPEDKRPELKIVFGTKKSQRITDEELAKAYSESLVTLSLSRFDTFGLVTLESMACGTPVIALQVAGYKETLVDKQNGFFAEFDPQEIAEKIMRFIDNPRLSEEMGEQGRKWVEEKWNWESQIKNLEKLLITFAKSSR